MQNLSLLIANQCPFCCTDWFLLITDLLWGAVQEHSFFETEGCAKKCNGSRVCMLGILGLLCDDVHGGRRCGRQELSRVLACTSSLPCPCSRSATTTRTATASGAGPHPSPAACRAKGAARQRATAPEWVAAAWFLPALWGGMGGIMQRNDKSALSSWFFL